MDLTALVLVLVKYFGLYWLFDFKVDNEYPARQLELTIGLTLAHLLMYSAYALFTGDYLSDLVGYLTIYVVALFLEAMLWLYYDKIMVLLGEREYRRMRYFRIGKASTISQRIIRTFNVTYVIVLFSVYYLKNKLS